MSIEPYIDVQSISKTFWSKKKISFLRSEKKAYPALSSISFQMKKGEMMGLVGPNGAGKSTLLHILSGLLLPDSGTISVGGLEPGKDRKKYVAKIGVLLAGKNRLSDGLSVIDALEWNSRFFGIDGQLFRKRLDYFTQLLELEQVLNKQQPELSLGEQMRAELINVFMHEPEIVFLDEPTIGVDVTVKETIRRFLRQMNEAHHLTMILTSHDQGDIQSVCKRTIVLEKGKLIREEFQ